ncbi:sugar phosphate isomerase/epimerase family protein [Paenibacillus cremeus]|uniref:Sugar phosphate isomerase/epimerase n=1 Tax=Paenibacillus cremeus TaxID=2163881 RepID=A0A559JRB8_9BACL|nr:sugar phosphate isomerase/epimerase [Paenibacillus cremeus]TVY02413.1 sugar phosphate isomerase/epimerase [Paenibacillus cremeus]
MKYGILANSFGKLPVQFIAEKTASAGFGSIQFALGGYGHVPLPFDTGLGRLNAGIAHYVADAFIDCGVRIPVLGCYMDFVHKDDEVRRQNIARFKEHLRFAREFGAGAVVTETGKIASSWRTEGELPIETGYQRVRQAIEELAEEAEKWGVFLGLEACQGHVIHNAELMQRIIEEVPSSNIGVVMDPVNLLHAGNVQRQDEVLQDAFDRLGDRIIHAHAKDFNVSAEGAMQFCSPGTGNLNYSLFMSLLRRTKPCVHVTFERTPAESIAAALQFMSQLPSEVEVAARS